MPNYQIKTKDNNAYIYNVVNRNALLKKYYLDYGLTQDKVNVEQDKVKVEAVNSLVDILVYDNFKLLIKILNGFFDDKHKIVSIEVVNYLIWEEK